MQTLYNGAIWDKSWLESLAMIQCLRKNFTAFLSHLHNRDRGRTGNFSFVLYVICLHFNYCFILVIRNFFDFLNNVILNSIISGRVLLWVLGLLLGVCVCMLFLFFAKDNK